MGAQGTKERRRLVLRVHGAPGLGLFRYTVEKDVEDVLQTIMGARQGHVPAAAREPIPRCDREEALDEVVAHEAYFGLVFLERLLDDEPGKAVQPSVLIADQPALRGRPADFEIDDMLGHHVADHLPGAGNLAAAAFQKPDDAGEPLHRRGGGQPIAETRMEEFVDDRSDEGQEPTIAGEDGDAVAQVARASGWPARRPEQHHPEREGDRERVGPVLRPKGLFREAFGERGEVWRLMGVALYRDQCVGREEHRHGPGKLP